VSAGVRNRDGVADGHSGSVRQGPRQDRSGSETAAEVPCRPDTNHAHLAWTCRGPRKQRPAATVRSASDKLHVPGGYRKDHAVSTLVAGVQDATGHLPRRQSAVDTSMATDPSPVTCGDTDRPDDGRSGSSGRSIR
jgi:hypothetical protein